MDIFVVNLVCLLYVLVYFSVNDNGMRVNMSDIGDKLKNARKANGMTIEDIEKNYKDSATISVCY